jgi:WD40 repeat protein
MAADPTQLKVVKNLGFDGIFFGMARVPNSGRLFYGSSDFKVYEIDTEDEKPQPTALSGEGHQSYVTGVALSAAGVVSGSYDGRLIWWDADERRQLRSIDAHDLWIRGVIASPDGKMISSVADDMVCKLWDAESGELLHALRDHQPVTPHNYPSMLYANAFSADGKLLATGDKVGHVSVWNVESGEKLAELETPVMYTWDPRQRRHSIGGIRSLAFTADSKHLAVGGIGKIGNIDHLGGPARIEIFDWQAGKRLYELEDDKHKGLVEQLAFHPDGKWFLSAGGDHSGFVTFYDAESGKILHQEKAPMHVHRFAFNESYDTLYAVGHGRIAVWELKAEDAEPVESEGS